MWKQKNFLWFSFQPVRILPTVKSIAKSLDIHDISSSFWTSLIDQMSVNPLFGNFHLLLFHGILRGVWLLQWDAG